MNTRSPTKKEQQEAAHIAPSPFSPPAAVESPSRPSSPSMAKAARKAAARQKSRRHLRENFLSWDESLAASSTLPLSPDFKSQQDRDLYDDVIEALSAKSIHAVFNELATVLHCEPSAIGLIERQGIRRAGKQNAPALLRFKHDKKFITALESHPSVTHHAATHAWNLNTHQAENDKHTLDALLLGKFIWLIDIESMAIYKGPLEDAIVAGLAFHPLPFHRALQVEDLKKTCLATLQMMFPVATFTIHNGTCFVPLPPSKTLYTHQPIILLRMRPSSAPATLISISSATGEIESVERAEQSNSPRSIQQLQGFKKAVQWSRLPAFETTPPALH